MMGGGPLLRGVDGRVELGQKGKMPGTEVEGKLMLDVLRGLVSRDCLES